MDKDYVFGKKNNSFYMVLPGKHVAVLHRVNKYIQLISTTWLSKGVFFLKVPLQCLFRKLIGHGIAWQILG